MRRGGQDAIRLAYERRNRDLDPQLVWRGKDEQDWSDLIVAGAAALHPGEGAPEGADRRSAAQSRRTRGARRAPPAWPTCSPTSTACRDKEAATEFYQHDANWSNRMILGDSLSVMASLAEREGLRGQGAVHLSRPALRHQVQLEFPVVDDAAT